VRSGEGLVPVERSARVILIAGSGSRKLTIIIIIMILHYCRIASINDSFLALLRLGLPCRFLIIF